MMQPQYIDFKTIEFESNGSISIANVSGELPFDVKRIYWTYSTPMDIVRGRHAHYATQQVLIAVAGKIAVKLINAMGEESNYNLDSPATGLLIPPNCWHTMTYSPDAVQLVLASSDFDEKDYIRDFDEFRSFWLKQN